MLSGPRPLVSRGVRVWRGVDAFTCLFELGWFMLSDAVILPKQSILVPLVGLRSRL